MSELFYHVAITYIGKWILRTVILGIAVLDLAFMWTCSENDVYLFTCIVKQAAQTDEL